MDHYSVRAGSDLPFVPFGPGTLLQLVHADLEQDLYVIRCRFEPGTTYPPHRHGGPVHGVTISGRWRYLEFPEIVSAGSYSFDPGGRTLTLSVLDDQVEQTDVVFVCHGPTSNVDDFGGVTDVVDAAFLLKTYTALCREEGMGEPEVISGR
jgi:2,4'-dihydroxyacetophenone dioxygenase